MKVRLRPLLAGVAVAAALLAVTVLGSGNYRPRDYLQSHGYTTVESPTPGKPSDITAQLSIPKGDVNFAAFIAYIPQNWGIVTGDHIPIGAPVGTLDANSVSIIARLVTRSYQSRSICRTADLETLRTPRPSTTLTPTTRRPIGATDPNGLFRGV